MNTKLKTNSTCPICNSKGRIVKSITLVALLNKKVLSQLKHTDQFRFCFSSSCKIVYYNNEMGKTINVSDLKVRVGQKETSDDRKICYCFNYTANDLKNEIQTTGNSTIPEQIKEHCRKGEDRCSETNPQGGCCLGNVAAITKPLLEDKSTMMKTTLEQVVQKKVVDSSIIAQVGAFITALMASACCWLPLLLVSFGISGTALSSFFESWRSVLLPITFMLLGAAFYFSYLKPKSFKAKEDCCTSPIVGKADDCNLAQNTNKFRLKKMNRIMLWTITVIILIISFFPNFVGLLISNQNSLSGRKDLDTIAIELNGVNNIDDVKKLKEALSKLNNYVDFEIDINKDKLLVGFKKGSNVSITDLLTSIKNAGNYKGSVVNEVIWSIGIAGMTCDACTIHVQKNLSKISGVYGASVNFNDETAIVSSNNLVDKLALETAIKSAGYKVKEIKRKQK